MEGIWPVLKRDVLANPAVASFGHLVNVIRHGRRRSSLSPASSRGASPDAQPQYLAPPERLWRVRLIGQLGDCSSHGAHPGLICHEAACRRPCRWQPLDPH
jgi:hypothetical protein